MFTADPVEQRKGRNAGHITPVPVIKCLMLECALQIIRVTQEWFYKAYYIYMKQKDEYSDKEKKQFLLGISLLL
jgi:hypothetical protein